MFVPYEPDMIFDVERHTDRCVCGHSALGTCHKSDSINYGYCSDCAKKRTDFVNHVTGEIYIGEEKCFEYYVLETIENLRQNIFREKFYYIVDNYFGKHQNDDEFVEPYDDAAFLATVYREKRHMTQTFLSNIILQKENKFSALSTLNRLNTAYSQYKLELEKMTKSDYEILGELTAKAGGYTYKKEVKQ